MSNKFLSGRIKELLLGIVGRTEDKTVLQTTGTVGIGTTNSLDYTLYVDGSTNIDGGVNVTGVSTFQDRVIFDSTNSIQIPSGTEGQKDAVGVAVTGQIRFNTTNQQFEGFGVGNNWGSLGGVKDVDGDTYILAETTAGSDEDILYFYTGGNLSGILSTTGLDLNVDLNVDGNIDLDNVNISGVTTFTNTTDNTLGDADTGAVQIDGGLGVNKNVTVGAGLSVVSGFNVAGVSTFQDNIEIPDDVRVTFGASDDLTVYHDAAGTSDTYIKKGGSGNLRIFTNQLFLKEYSGSDYLLTATVNNAVELYYSGNKKFGTTGAGVTVFGTTFSEQLNVSGIATFHSDVHLGDHDILNLGTGNDLKIYHNGNNSFVSDIGTGDLNITGDDVIIASAGFENKAKFLTDGAVELYYDNSKKFETTGIGVSVSSGAGLTATIAGPTNLILDPAAVGDNTGIVRIKGDLYVDGAEVKVDSTTINLADLKIGIATAVGTNLLLDGGGIGIGSANIEKTILWNNSNSRMEFNADLYAPNFTTGELNASTLTITGISTNESTLFAQQLNVAGVSTYAGLVDINAGGQANTFKVEDLTDNRVVIAGTGGELEDDANLTFNGSTLSVGVDLDVDGHTELDNVNVSGAATIFKTNGSDLLHLTRNTSGGGTDLGFKIGVGNSSANATNIQISRIAGNTSILNITDQGDIYPSGNGTADLGRTNNRFDNLYVQNIDSNNVDLTLKPGLSSNLTIEDSILGETRAVFTPNQVELYYDNSKKLETTGYGATVFGGLHVSGIATVNHIDVNSISPDGSDTGASGYVPVADGAGGWNWLNVSGASAVNTILNGFTVNEEGVVVGTAASITTLDFRGGNVLVSADPQPNGIATITFSPNPVFDTLNVTGISTFSDDLTIKNSSLKVTNTSTSGNYLEAYQDNSGAFYLNKVGTGSFFIEGNNIYIGDDGSNETYAGFQKDGSSYLNHDGTKRLETTGYGATVYNDLRVGTGVTIYGNSGIVSATSFYGDGSNLTNTGATLSAATGTQRLVLTSLTSGTMVDAATDSDLTYDATSDKLNVANIDISGISTLGGPVTAGTSEGVSGQYLRNVGTGVTWASFPTLRTTQTSSAANGQTTFNFTYNVNFLDVFINGVKLTSSEYTASNGTSVVLATPAFENDTVEFHSYNTTSTGAAGGGASNLNGLSDVTISSLADDHILQYNSSTNVFENVAAPYATTASVGLATAGLASEVFVGLATAGLASESYVNTQVGLATVGLTNEAFVGLATAGLASESYVNTQVGLATVGLLTATGDASNLTGLTGASAATYGNSTAVPQIVVDANGRITGITNVLISGGGGGGGTSIIVNDSQSLVGTAGTIDFGTGLSVSPVSAGIVTVTATETDPVVGAVNGIVKANGSGTISAATAGTDYLTPTGDGSGLTGISTNVVSKWNITASGSDHYVFEGPGLDGAQNDPTIYLLRGQMYVFDNNSGGHPLQIQYEGGNTGGTQYNDGIQNNNVSGAELFWNVQNDAPDVLYYQCTSHTNMWGKIIILGESKTEGSWTAAAGVLNNIDTITGIANNNFKAAEYMVHISNGGNMQAQKVLVMQDGTTASSTEYAVIYDNSLLVSIGASVHGGNFYLNATPETGITGITTFRFTRQTIR